MEEHCYKMDDEIYLITKPAMEIESSRCYKNARQLILKIYFVFFTKEGQNNLHASLRLGPSTSFLVSFMKEPHLRKSYSCPSGTKEISASQIRDAASHIWASSDPQQLTSFYCHLVDLLRSSSLGPRLSLPDPILLLSGKTR